MTWYLIYIMLFVNRIYVTLILFALHYIQQNARSTVQTEQAMAAEIIRQQADFRI